MFNLSFMKEVLFFQPSMIAQTDIVNLVRRRFFPFFIDIYLCTPVFHKPQLIEKDRYEQLGLKNFFLLLIYILLSDNFTGKYIWKSCFFHSLFCTSAISYS